jgi:hypothetical protein
VQGDAYSSRWAGQAFAELSRFCGTTAQPTTSAETRMAAGARSRDRTGTPSLARDFKSDAKTRKINDLGLYLVPQKPDESA